MWFDTHCHLDAGEFAADRAAVAARAAAVGVDHILVPAVGVENFGAVHNLQKNPAGAALTIHAAYGIHPMYTPQARDADLPVLRRWLADAAPVAVGEIGLDGYVPGLDMARQEFFFAEQLKLAVEAGLPVVLHVRRAQDLVLKHLRRHRRYFAARGPGRSGIAHAFNGSRQQADAFIELGFCLGFGGAMTFDGSTRIRALAATLPAECLVLETDAPDISPAWLDGGRNEPGELARIGATLAALRGEPVADVAATCSRNAARLFGLTS